jgi:hypothetical protein
MLQTIQQQIDFLKQQRDLTAEDAPFKTKSSYNSEIIHLERLANADQALQAAIAAHAKSVKIDEKTDRTRDKLQGEMQSATKDQKAANDALTVAETNLKTAQASAYRGKVIDLAPMENAYSKAVERVQILNAAITSIQIELDELPTPTAKLAAIELRSAQEFSKQLKQWHLDRKVAIAALEAVAHIDSHFVSPKSYCAGFQLEEHLTQLAVFKHEAMRVAKIVA